MNKQYITSIFKDGIEYAGQEISASSWEEAETRAKEQDIILIGELAQGFSVTLGVFLAIARSIISKPKKQTK